MILVAYAMPEERPSGSFPESCTLVQTGIGKVLAVCRVARLLQIDRPDMLISVGFCGGLNGTRQGEMVMANAARQWDLHLSDLNIPLGHGYAMHCPLRLPEVSLESVPRPVRGAVISGDRFVDASVHVDTDAVAVDMETAALALLARELKIPFVSVREVSDVADGPQTQTHAQFLERIRRRGPDYSEAVRELLDRGPDGIPAPSIPNEAS